MANVATAEEIERSWTMLDVVRWNEILDVKQEVENREKEKLENK